MKIEAEWFCNQCSNNISNILIFVQFKHHEILKETEFDLLEQNFQINLPNFGKFSKF